MLNREEWVFSQKVYPNSVKTQWKRKAQIVTLKYRGMGH